MTDERVLPCVLDGVVIPEGVVLLSANAEVLTHGEGLFESFLVLGGRGRFLDAHLARLDEGSRKLGLGGAPAAERVHGEVATLAKVAGVADFAARLTQFRDGHLVRLLIAANPLPPDANRPVAIGLAASWLNGPRSLAALKTINYLVPRLAQRDGAARGLDEAVFTMPDGTVLEGTRSSVFIVEAGAVVTPPLTLPILPGVTREVILDAARGAAIPVREEPFTVDRMLAADEVFISASIRGLRQAVSFDGKKLGASAEVTQRLAALYAESLAAG